MTITFLLEQQAQEILFRLAQRLYEKHGLTLSASKTKIQSTTAFNRRFDADPDAEVDARISRVRELSLLFDAYSGEEREPTDEEIAEFMDLNITELIAESLEDRGFVDYPTLSSLLKHPAIFSALPDESRKNLGDLLLRNAQHLYPLAEDVAGFFASFVDLGAQDKRRLRDRILAALRPKRGKWPPEYYIMWMVNIFAQSDAWGHSPEFARIYREHRSDVVRRMAALAIGANGTRADALEARDGFSAASPLEQLAILVATKRLGIDERKHWKRALQLRAPLERRL